ncbi:MAG TPA: UvrD-helicase domain-containing protein [Steroidobacteraceae bacterium]
MTAIPSAGGDAAARHEAVASNSSVLVQAPAGSGKTTLLTQRYLRLLVMVDAPESILALTFTRRAAQEMRRRVLEALGSAKLDDCPKELSRETWDLARAAQRHMNELNLDLQLQPTRLRIETIDAFNAWLAKQLPISAGVGSSLDILTDPRPAYEEAARRTLAHERSDQFGIAVERVLALDDQRWRSLVALIAERLPSRDRWLPLLAGRLQAASVIDEAQLASVRRHFDEDLRLLVTRGLLRAQEILGGEIIAALTPLLGIAAEHAPDAAHLAPWLNDSRPLKPDAADVARWRSLAKLLLTGKGLRKRFSIREGFPPRSAHKQAMTALAEQLAADSRIAQMLADVGTLPDPEYSDEEWARVREVAQVMVFSAAELDGVFREQGAADFTAISLAALRALGQDDAPTDLNLRLDYRLRHILIDEFQDTSGTQIELLRRLTAGWQENDGRSIFCVGDPMQSIYGFRQAEVRAFLELADEGLGAVRFEVKRLRSNFRSAKGLVDWFNECFARLMPSRDDRNRGAIAFRRGEAAVDKPSAGTPEIQLLGFTGRATESSAIAGLIAAQLELQPQWRIAVLVRAKEHAREIAAGLRARRIAFRAVDIEPLQDRAVVRDIITLTRALLHLGDRIAWLALLRAPWAGLCLADILLLSRGAALVWDAICDSSVLLELSEDGRARCLRLRATLSDAFRVRNDSGLTRWVERTWISLGGASGAGGPQDLELAEAAFSRLLSLEQQGMPDADDLPARFADLFADYGTASGVEIMTIHKAKGLEFDMVILPALDRSVPHGHAQLLLTHQFARTGRDGMVMAARPPLGASGNRLFGFLRRQERDAADLEAQRLLYVACTRARSRLCMTATIGRSAPRAGSLLAVLWPAAGGQFVPQGDTARTLPETDAPRGGPLRRLPATWVAPIMASPAAAPASMPTINRDEWPIFDWAGETARRVGSLVHAELQTMIVESTDEPSIRARRDHFMRWLSLHGVPSDRLDQAVMRVTDALLGVHGDPRGRWILKAGYRDDMREHALSGQYQDQVLRAVFDRSFIDDAGIRWVIDYKTSQHLGSGIEQFLDREVERYRPQLQRYGRLASRLGPEPVRLGLYFPLMCAWREWAFGIDSL